MSMLVFSIKTIQKSSQPEKKKIINNTVEKRWCYLILVHAWPYSTDLIRI